MGNKKKGNLRKDPTKPPGPGPNNGPDPINKKDDPTKPPGPGPNNNKDPINKKDDTTKPPGPGPNKKDDPKKPTPPPKLIPGINHIINKLDQQLNVYSARTIYNNDPLKKPTEVGHISKNEVETPHAINLLNEFTKINVS